MIANRILSLLRFIFSLLVRYRALILLLFVIFVLRIPSLFEPHRYADEEIYLTLGQGFRKGLVFYRDIHDNKPPLLYLVAALAGNIFWFRFILLIVHALGVIIFFKLAQLVFRNRRWAVLLATWFFALLSTLPSLEGNIANGENFMIVPALAGTFFLYRVMIRSDDSSPVLTYPVIGFLFSIAFFFKVPIAFDFLGLLTVWLLFTDPVVGLQKRLRLLLSNKFWLVTFSFALPILISVVYFTLKGAFEPYFRSALLQNIGYLTTWGGDSGSVLNNPLIWRGLIVLAVVAFLYRISRSLSFEVRLVSIWTIFSLYGALLSSRPYPHYLLEPLVPVSYLILMPFTQTSIRSRLVAILVFVFVVYSYFENGFWYYKTLPYYQNFLSFVSGSKNWDEYQDFWGVKRNYVISDYIRQRSDSSDRIFVWGTEPSIYSLTDRLPVGRYTVAYHIYDFDAFDETMQALVADPPIYIVVIDDLTEFSELNSFLEEQYFIEAHIDGAVIYRKHLYSN